MIPRPVRHNATLPPLRPQHDLSDMTGSPDMISDCLPSDVRLCVQQKANGAPRQHPMGAHARLCVAATSVCGVCFGGASWITRPPQPNNSTKIPQLDHDRIRIPSLNRTRNRIVFRAFHPTAQIASAFAIGACGEFAGAGVQIECDRFAAQHHR